MDSRKKISISLKKEIISRIDDKVDGVNIRNRSHAIEALLMKALGDNKIGAAFILAGGQGTRMRPFTYEMPKPMIPVHGKPLLEHIILLLRKYDVRDIILSVGYLKEKIVEHFGDGKKLGVKIRYVEEKEKLGTAGPLNLARDLIDDTFFMFNGDILANIDLESFAFEHKSNSGIGTIALTPVEDASKFGVVDLRGGKILKFIEKPKGKKYGLINAGIYILEPEVMDYIPEGKAMMEKDVFPKLAKDGKLFGYPFESAWFDTGTHEAYERVIKEWKDID